MELFLQTAVRILPVFLTIFVGLALKRLGLLPDTVKEGMVNLVFYVGTPALIVKNLLEADLGGAMDARFLVYVAAAVLALIGVSWLCALPFGEKADRGAVIQLGYRANIAIIGLPIATAIMDAEGVSLMALAMTVGVLIYNVTIVLILSYYGEKGKPNLKATLIKVAKNPLLIAIVIGVLVNFCTIPIKESAFMAAGSIGAQSLSGLGKILLSILGTLGDIASSIGLLVIGAGLTFGGKREEWPAVLVGVGLKTVISPLLLLVPAVLFGFRGDALLCLAVIGAAPTAVNSYVMAKKMGVSDSITARGISLSCIASLFAVFVSVWLLRYLGLA